jgi:hypothetical protein
MRKDTKVGGGKLWKWNTLKIFAPPSAQRNFFKCSPLTWNPGSAPGLSRCMRFKYHLLRNLINMMLLDVSEYRNLWIKEPVEEKRSTVGTHMNVEYLRCFFFINIRIMISLFIGIFRVHVLILLMFSFQRCTFSHVLWHMQGGASSEI